MDAATLSSVGQGDARSRLLIGIYKYEYRDVQNACVYGKGSADLRIVAMMRRSDKGGRK